MSHPTETGVNRRQLLETAGAAAATIAAASLAIPAAADAATEFVPFKATAQGPIPDPLQIPLNPPIVSQHLQLTGSAEPLGAITHVEYHIAHVGVDGAFKSVSQSEGVMSAANGDAVFLKYSGLVRPTADGGIMVESAFLITGGRGRFAGASGSGTLLTTPDLVKKVVSFAWDGLVSAPKG